jgi:hypothetical protein
MRLGNSKQVGKKPKKGLFNFLRNKKEKKVVIKNTQKNISQVDNHASDEQEF